MSDVSVPEQLGRVVGRHLPLAGLSAGLALVIAAVGMLGMFLWAGFVPVEYESSVPIGEVCTTTGQCFEVDSEAVEQRLEDDLVPAICARLDQEHPYQVPGVVAIPIIATSQAYGDWLLAQTDAIEPGDTGPG